MNMNNHTPGNSNYRYPGSRPFYDTDIDRRLFFGRDKETQLLLHQILTDTLTVLYAKSGLGKTSLINAGLNQALRDKGFLPFSIRFNNPDIDPLKRIYDTIKDSVGQKELDYEAGEENSLWQFFKTAVFWGPGNKLLKPVIILDQFEEFFALYSIELRQIFTRQLSDVINNTPPTELVASIPAGEPFPYSDKAPNVKVIISIREDYLGQLEEMSEDIPNILHNRFRLTPLNREQAREAIVQPSQVKDEAIRATSFKFSNDAVDSMLDFLCKRVERGITKMTDEVESFQLQLLCRHLEDKARKKQKKWKGEVLVNEDDLGGEMGMHQVLERFYDDQINRLESEDEREKVCRLCEEGFISITDRRLSLEEEEIERNFSVSESLLQNLVNWRLLRSEPRVGSIYYELSHDTLVAPIRESQKKRKEKAESINKLYQEARKLKITSDYDGAAEKYKAILDIDKSQLNVYLELGQVYYDKKEYDEAVKIYNMALSNDFKDAHIFYGLGQVFFATGKPEEAIKNYRESLTIDPELSITYEGLGDVYARQKEFKNAVDNYEEALKIDKKKQEIYTKLAKVYVKKREPDKAIEIYQQALKVNIDYAGIYTEIAKALQIEEKENLIEKIYAIASESGSKNAYHYWILGADYQNIKDYDKAVKNYQKAIELDPDDTFFYHRVGEALHEMEKYNDAIEVFKKAIAIDPDDAYNYLKMGHALRELRKYNEAVGAYKKASEVKPDDSHAYYWMGHTLDLLKDYKAAVEAFKKTIAINPDDAYNYLKMGHALRELRKYNEAVGAYKKASEVQPDDSHAYYWMGYVLYLIKDYNAAVEAFKKAIEIDPKDAYAYLNMGRALRELEKYNDTIEAYKKTLRFAPESIIVTIKKELAEVYLIAEHFKKTDELANKMLKEQKTPVKYKLAMRLISISSSLFQGKQQQALSLLNKFISYYKDIPRDFDTIENYSDIRNFLSSNKKLPQQQIQLLLKLIDLLEASSGEEFKKLEELEASIQKTFKD